MDEQTEQITATQTPPAQQQAPQPAPVNEAASLLSSLGNFLTDADRAALEELSTGQTAATPQAQQPGNDPPAEQKPEQQAAQQTAAPAQKGDDVAAGEQKTEPKKSVLGLNKKKTEQNSGLVIENPDHLLTAVKSKYGQEYKDLKEMPKFFESVDKWRKDAQKVEEISNKYSSIEKEILALPVEFHEAIQELRNGGDYRKPFMKGVSLDYNKPADKQDVKALVNHYYPNKFAETDFEGDKSQALTIAEESAIQRFNVEKQIHDNKRAEVATNADKINKARQEALESSVNGLQERFPEMDAEAFNQVKSALEGGPQKVLSLFFNNDGTAKPDAAVKLTMSLFGESELLPDAMEVAAHITETKLNEELLTRGADGPKPNRSNGGQPEQVPAEVKTKIDEMNRIAGAKNRTY